MKSDGPQLVMFKAPKNTFQKTQQQFLLSKIINLVIDDDLPFSLVSNSFRERFFFLHLLTVSCRQKCVSAQEQEALVRESEAVNIIFRRWAVTLPSLVRQLACGVWADKPFFLCCNTADSCKTNKQTDEIVTFEKG